MSIHEIKGNGVAHKRDQLWRSPPPSENLFPGLGLAELDLFTDQHGEAHATIRTPDGSRTLRLKSEAFRNWLICRYLDRGIPYIQGQIRDQIAMLVALASRQGRELHNRSAWTEDRAALDIDLADPAGRVVRVRAGRWDVIGEALVGFQRYAHQECLPDPEPQGDHRALLEFLPPLRSAGDELLVLTWTLAALVPMGRPILMLIGEQGSGKTTASRAIRRLVDPSMGDLLGQDGRADLFLTLSQHAVPVLDNIETLSKKESDLLCRGVTGGAIARRVLWTDAEEFLRRFRRAIIVNGLAPPTNRADLLDRSLIIGLNRLTPEQRRTQSRIDSDYEAARPRLFGGLLNALQETLALLPTTPDDNLCRMGDFHRFGRAASRALGFTIEQFDAAMRDAEARQSRGAADNTLAAAMMMFVRQQGRWVGDASSLLERLIDTAKAHQLSRSRKFWPETGIGLGRKIDQLGAVLAAHGVTITRERHSRERLIHLEYNPAADANHQGEE